MFQGFTDGFTVGVWEDQLKGLDVGFGGGWVGHSRTLIWLPAQPSAKAIYPMLGQLSNYIVRDEARSKVQSLSSQGV